MVKTCANINNGVAHQITTNQLIFSDSMRGLIPKFHCYFIHAVFFFSVVPIYEYVQVI